MGFNGNRRRGRYDKMIREIMDEYGIDPNTVPSGKNGCVVQYCTGNFKCPNCGDKTWKSSWSWIKFDLRNQRIKYRFHQKCNACLTPTKPYLEDYQMERVVRKVCRKYLRRTNNEESEIEEVSDGNGDGQEELKKMQAILRGTERSSQNHRRDLCEKCGYGVYEEACYAQVIRRYREYLKEHLKEFPNEAMFGA